MIRTPLTSSSIKSVGYDPATRALHVEFHSGRVYEHADVPSHLADEFQTATSVGRFYNALIRGKFPHTEVTPSAPTAESE